MADRSVQYVEDKPVEVPVIENVYVLNKKVITEPSNDAFLKKAEELKPLDGTTPAFKRKVTTQINKVRRGQGDAESSTIHEDTFMTGYDMYDVIEPPHSLDSLAKLYEKSPPHYAAVNAKVANIVGLGYRFVETPKTKRALEQLADNEAKVKKMRRTLDLHREELNESIEKMNKEDTFTETMVKVWRDYEVTGNAYLEIGRKKDGSIGYIGHIPVQTLRIRRKRDGFVQISGFKVQFFANFGDSLDDDGKVQAVANPISGSGKKTNEVIHLKKYSPTSGYYGIPDIIAAQGAVAGNHFAEQFNLDYFENKAVPRHVIILKGAKLGTQAESSLLSFFETGLKGQNHRSLYIPLPGDTQDNKVELKIEAVEAGIQDASFEKYRKANINDILMVHRVPITKISVAEGASLAVAKDADKTFKEQVCAPEQQVFEKKLSQVIDEMTDAFELKLNEMTLTDEDTQSKIDERNVKAGIDLPNEVRARKGMPGVEGGNDRVDLNAKDKIAQAQAEERTQRERDSARSAGATDSSGEARSPKGEGRSTS